MNIFSKIGNWIDSRRIKQSSVSASQDDIIRLLSMAAGGTYISPLQALEYYESVSPVFTGINKLAKGFSAITPHIYNKETMKFEDDKGKEVLALLNHPNADKTQKEFMFALAAFYLSTGNTYILAGGNVNVKPLEITVIPPQDVMGIPAITDFSAAQYNITNQRTFVRDEKPTGFRYLTNDSLSELWHIRTFNTGISTKLFNGLSPLSGVYYEIKQHIKASIHNISLLTKGARLSGIIFGQGEFTKVQRDIVTSEIRNRWQGEDNTGEMGFMSGGKFDFKELSQKIKDMDFRNLKNDVTLAIYIALDIPLPEVNPDSMSMNNYKEGKLALLDNAVLPLTDRMYEELTNFLFPRFKLDSNKYILAYNPAEIPALAARSAEIIETKSKSGAYTKDEIRALSNLPPVPGGDVIYQPINLVPLGTSPIQKTTAEKFIEIMRNYKDSDGNRRYSDEQIKKMTAKFEQDGQW